MARDRRISFTPKSEGGNIGGESYSNPHFTDRRTLQAEI